MPWLSCVNRYFKDFFLDYGPKMIKWKILTTKKY